MSTTTPTTEKRTGTKEEFELAQAGDTHVNVRNNSHTPPTCYTIEVNDGTAISCTCPHHVYRNAFCKHMDAVEIANTCDCDGMNYDKYGVPCWGCARAGRKEFDA